MPIPCSPVTDTFYGYSPPCPGQNRVLPNARGCGPYPGLGALPTPVPSGQYVGAPGKFAGDLRGLGGCGCGGQCLPCSLGGRGGGGGGSGSSAGGGGAGGQGYQPARGRGVTILDGAHELRMRPLGGIDWGDVGRFLCQFVAASLGVTADYYKTRSEAQLRMDLTNAMQVKADLQQEVNRWGGVEIVANILKTTCATGTTTTSPTPTTPTTTSPTTSEIQQFLAAQQAAQAAEAARTRQWLMVGGVAAAGLAVVLLLRR